MTGPAWALGPTAVLLLAAALAGGPVLRRLRTASGPGESLLYALAIGIGIQAALLLACAALGWMHPAVLWVAVIAPALPGLRDWRQVLAAVRSLESLLRALGPLERTVTLGVATAALFILVVAALTPVSDWDSLMYHLRLPRQFLDAGRLYLPPDGNHLAFLGLFQFLYLPLMAIGAEAGPALLNAAMAMALWAGVFVAGTRLLSRRTGVLAATALWGSSAWLFVGATPRVDVALAFVLLMTHCAVLRTGDERSAWAIPVAGLLGGIALGMKYHALPYLAALVPLALWGLRGRPGGNLGHHARAVGLAMALGVLASAPWLLKNVAYFDAPFYPFFSAPRVQPFVAELTGSYSVPTTIDPESLRGVGRSRERVSLAALVLRPERLTVEVEGASYSRNPLYAALLLLPFFLRDRRLLGIAVPGLAYLTFTLGYFSVTNLRYLLPALPMLAIASAELWRRAGETLSRVPRMRYVTTLLIALAGGAALLGLRRGGERLLSMERVQIALGLLPAQVALNREVPYVVARYFDEQVAPDATVLMLWDARGYHFTRNALQDNLLTNWPMLEGIGATARCLAGTGITHVYVNLEAPRYYERRGLDLASLGWDRFPAFAERCLDPMAVLPGLAIYRVR
ncbi:MAG: hypothetical protein KF689_00355 [Gemmatimonadaceae bacterium]|nr:hypothetical protein [Gemmatimonadaceae bacterium]MCW5826378.1 hypothetical protein [Gemmatimonadaceae bacterium]